LLQIHTRPGSLTLIHRLTNCPNFKGLPRQRLLKLTGSKSGGSTLGLIGGVESRVVGAGRLVGAKDRLALVRIRGERDAHRFSLFNAAEHTAMASNLLHLSIFAFFPTLMALSASMDLLTFTIPNRICVALGLGYVISASLLGVPVVGILLNISCALAILGITFVMFNFGLIGGGDAKLAAATAAWLGWAAILNYGLAASIFGGILTLILLGVRRVPLPAALARVAWVARLHNAGAGVPYGIALAAAGLMQFPNSSIWAAVV
jgi:prepilin peptidase CpaA